MKGQTQLPGIQAPGCVGASGLGSILLSEVRLPEAILLNSLFKKVSQGPGPPLTSIPTHVSRF